MVKPTQMMPRWLQILISFTLSTITAGVIAGVMLLAYIHGNTSQIPTMQTTLIEVKGHTENIEGMKSEVDKLMGKLGVAEVAPSGTLTTENVAINIPPNSTFEPTLFRLEKVPASDLPATLPSKDYEYTDSFVWSTEGLKHSSDVYIWWGLSSGADCLNSTILYWNSKIRKWQDIPPENCSTISDQIGFSTEYGGYYVLAKEK